MELHRIIVKSANMVTHDVIKIVTTKTSDLVFTPGQAIEISLKTVEWEEEKRPFTFTCLPEDDYLEFTIKTYPERQGVTNQLLHAKEGDELILHEVFGAISYQGEGLFIAGGAGVTPFIAIFRYLKSTNQIGNNKLLFSNKTKADIILEEEFRKLLGANFINILSEENADGYAHGQITKDIIRENISFPNQKFYLCGPPPMMETVEKQLAELHISESAIIKESF